MSGGEFHPTPLKRAISHCKATEVGVRKKFALAGFGFSKCPYYKWLEVLDNGVIPPLLFFHVVGIISKDVISRLAKLVAIPSSHTDFTSNAPPPPSSRHGKKQRTGKMNLHYRLGWTPSPANFKFDKIITLTPLSDLPSDKKFRGENSPQSPLRGKSVIAKPLRWASEKVCFGGFWILRRPIFLMATSS